MKLKLFYRPEIDGLRAIAVIFVLLYHAKFLTFEYEIFRGGYIGVDIFFVISGYLISLIILKELIFTGSFSFQNFYVKRVKRIIPTLLLVIFATLPLSWFVFLPNSFIDYSKSILFSLGFTSNFYFHYSGQEYGAASGLLKPFLHTWSLSIEEQFYIFYPIVLLFVFRYFKIYLIYFLLFGFLVSLGISDWGSKNYSSLNFYIMPTRGWELLAGAILAYLEIKTGYRNKNKTLKLLMPSIGILFIFYSIVVFDENTFHPSFFTLLPVIGTCLIIWFSSKDEIITKILSSKIFVSIGLISYSLYLWHYPIFSFSRLIKIKISLTDKIGLLFITFVLSILSYYLIEKPFRNKNLKIKKIFYILFISIFLILSFNVTILLNNGFPKRVGNISGYNFNKLNGYQNFIKTEDFKKFCKNEICKFNIKNSKNIILVGDSHAASLLPGLFNFAKRNDKGFISSIIPGCGFILNINRVNKTTGKVNKSCSDHEQLKRLDLINKHKESIVISFFRLPLIMEEDRFRSNLGYEGNFDDYIQNSDNSLDSKKNRQEYISNNFQLTIKKLLASNHSLLIIYPYPEVGVNVPEKLYNILRQSFIHKKNYTYEKKIETDYDLFLNRTKSSFKTLDKITDKNILRIYPHKYLCDNFVKNKCITHNNKDLYYFDDDHPSTKGAEIINQQIIFEIKNKFQSN